MAPLASLSPSMVKQRLVSRGQPTRDLAGPFSVPLLRTKLGSFTAANALAGLARAELVDAERISASQMAVEPAEAMQALIVENRHRRAVVPANVRHAADARWCRVRMGCLSHPDQCVGGRRAVPRRGGHVLGLVPPRPLYHPLPTPCSLPARDAARSQDAQGEPRRR
jgi:hypothetical protein